MLRVLYCLPKGKASVHILQQDTSPRSHIMSQDLNNPFYIKK